MKPLLAIAVLASVISGVRGETLEELLDASGVTGGVVVHLGCGDGERTVELRGNDTLLVHGLDADPSAVAEARKRLLDIGAYGPVSVDLFDGKLLPYADNLVNAVIAEDAGEVSTTEIMRVLAPLGVAYVKTGGHWQQIVKPWPDELDEWTHYLHDPSNNAVAVDTEVGPPQGMQWANYPLWDRGHSSLAGMSSMVSAGGRLFSIEDLAPIVLPRLPSKFALVARDAFNGTRLWTYPFSDWANIAHHMKGLNAQFTRRLVARDDRVYTTPGLDAPVVALDAATGEILKTYSGTESTREILLDRGVFYLVIGDPSKNYGYPSETSQYPEQMIFGRQHYNPRPKYFSSLELDQMVTSCSIVAIDATTGRRIWEKSGKATENYEGTTLAVAEAIVVYEAGGHLVCLDRATGDEQWRQPVQTSTARRRLTQAGGNPSVVATPTAVYRADMTGFQAFAANDGRELWRAGALRFGYHSSPDLFVANGAVWYQDNHTGYDPLTGEAVQTRGKCRTGPMTHDRCYRNRATCKFIIESKSGGSDFSTLGTSDSLSHPWARGTCSVGILPCNGLLYATPHACGCGIETSLNGFWALTARKRTAVSDPSPLHTGPAYGSPLANPDSPPPWPTYRQNMAREGSSDSQVPTTLERVWEVQLAASPTQAVVAEDTVFVAASDAHTIYALDLSSGETLWTFTAGGRIDASPTFHRGRLLFGSRDGWVYCLAAATGELAWKFRAAPSRELTCAYGQLESPWPVHGSVLVLDDLAYVSAGRHTFLDGGIFFYALEVATGKTLHKHVLRGPYEDDGEPVINEKLWASIQGNRNDVLVSDGKLIYLAHTALRRDLTRVDGIDEFTDHIGTPSSFFDNSRHHRSYWTKARIMPNDRSQRGAAIPDGDLLVVDGKEVYGVRGHPLTVDARSFDARQNGFVLFAMTQVARSQEPSSKPTESKKKNDPRGRLRNAPPHAQSDYRAKWTTGVAVNPLAMTMDRNSLFVAGLPNTYPEDDLFRAVEGRMGGVLLAASREDGATIVQVELKEIPTWDGMSAADGKLFLSCEDGKLICFGAKEH